MFGGLFNSVHALVVGAQLGVDAAVEEDLGDTRVAALARLKEGRLGRLSHVAAALDPQVVEDRQHHLRVPRGRRELERLGSGLLGASAREEQLDALDQADGRAGQERRPMLRVEGAERVEAAGRRRVQHGHDAHRVVGGDDGTLGLAVGGDHAHLLLDVAQLAHTVGLDRRDGLAHVDHLDQRVEHRWVGLEGADGRALALEAARRLVHGEVLGADEQDDRHVAQQRRDELHHAPDAEEGARLPQAAPHTVRARPALACATCSRSDGLF